MRSWVSKAVLILGLSVVTSACGREPKIEIGPEFQPYVTRFQEKGEEVGKPVQIVDLIVKFGQTDPKQDGVCETSDHTSPTILVNERAWNDMDDLGRESLMFHELGHCVLNRSHVLIKSSDGAPSSLMYPVAISLKTYLDNHEYYIRELFRATTPES
jgi:hypothetical protein